MPDRAPPPEDVVPGKAAAADDPGLDASLAYAAALQSGFKTVTTQVQHMHRAIAATTFDAVARVPGVSVPAGWVRGAHDLISDGVYAAIRGGGDAAFTLAGAAERLVSKPERAPRGAELQLRGALNAVAGDALAAGGSTLALRMAWFGGPRTPQALSPADIAAFGARVCVFVHGLACTEQSWLGDDEASRATPPSSTLQHYGALLARDLGISSVYLRYNTGLAIADNGDELAQQLDALAQAAPQVREWVLIGHSMGGLVARSAVDHAGRSGLAWRRRCTMLICLGTPHRGAPLAQLGHAVAGGLRLSRITQPLAHLADSRSRGVKDLRRGRDTRAETVTPAPEVLPEPALRLVSGSLGDADGELADRLVDRLLGDGLVTPTSAGDAGLAGGDVQRVSLPGLGHMALLKHPRVYALIKAWLTAPAAGAPHAT